MITRDNILHQLSQGDMAFDCIIIGGGATGIGISLEAATRGYRTLLLEKSDFTKSTSSKSTKLLHGGVRYLEQGNIALVREACIERGRLLKNAPHLAKNQSFIIPAFGLYHEILYTVGLTVYDLLAGKYSLGRSKRISKRKTLERIPTLDPAKLTAGIVYYDGQFDDSRLAINVIQTAMEAGALALNYMSVEGLSKDASGHVSGVKARDIESGQTYELNAKCVINATGVFTDDVLRMDKPGSKPLIKPSQGVHIVLDKAFLPGDSAIMIPKTDDGRVLFAVPWHNKVVVGTTDTPLEKASLEPVALEAEVDFILNTAGRYLTKTPTRADVRSVFAGLRPLAAPSDDGKNTKEISRSHKIVVSESQLLTMIGGKWTTFRKMAEDMIDKVEEVKGWKKTKSTTKNHKIHGYTKDSDFTNPLYVYGSDREKMLRVEEEFKDNGAVSLVSQAFPLYRSQVVWAVRHEMARTVEDVLSRRTRCLLLDARESVRIAPRVASIMAKELGKDAAWEQQQVADFEQTAKNYYFSS
jgi:glycerol-3-phosphate dehydrogenase